MQRSRSPLATFTAGVILDRAGTEPALHQRYNAHGEAVHRAGHDPRTGLPGPGATHRHDRPGMCRPPAPPFERRRTRLRNVDTSPGDQPGAHR